MIHVYTHTQASKFNYCGGTARFSKKNEINKAKKKKKERYLRPASTPKAQVPFFSLKKTEVWVYERYL